MFKTYHLFITLRTFWYAFCFIDCEFMDHNLGGYVGGKQAALESAFDYNDKNGAISKCRESSYSFIWIKALLMVLYDIFYRKYFHWNAPNDIILFSK